MRSSAAAAAPQHASGGVLRELLAAAGQRVVANLRAQ
jgi:hypothetical protein